jgi:hypothetical protein
MSIHFSGTSRPTKSALLSLLASVATFALQWGCLAERDGSTIEMLEPIAPATAKSDARGEVSTDGTIINPIPPSVIGVLASPEYPVSALAAHAGECVVYATVTIGPTGLVSEVVPSWQRVNIPNRFSEQYLDSIRLAVRGWRFEPARDVYWEKDGGGDLKYVRTENVPARVDIKFTFGPTGTVR